MVDPSHPPHPDAKRPPSGSGHEPAHAGYVGQGLLDAAVCGHVFASPNVKQIRQGIQLVNGKKGCVALPMGMRMRMGTC